MEITSTQAVIAMDLRSTVNRRYPVLQDVWRQSFHISILHLYFNIDFNLYTFSNTNTPTYYWMILMYIRWQLSDMLLMSVAPWWWTQSVRAQKPSFVQQLEINQRGKIQHEARAKLRLCSEESSAQFVVCYCGLHARTNWTAFQPTNNLACDSTALNSCFSY